jgi:hypothetical protein
MTQRINRKQFELAIKAVSNGVYYSAHPETQVAIQDLAIEDLQTIPEELKEKYINLREFGKDLFFTYPKGTTVYEIMMEYVDSIFEFIKDNEEKK